MRCIKGGVYGRALAQAWSAGQRGFSSYIRRSRDQRKAMVQSFVKEYKKSNNGGFPSITLIQQEVGGNFHVVRHILQELKATWSQIERSQKDSANEFPRGTISKKLRSSASLSPNGTVPDEHPRLDGEGQHHPISDAASKHEVIKDPIDGDLINVENVDSGEAKVVAGVLSSGSSEVEQLAEELPKVVVSIPSSEIRKSVEPIEAAVSMKMERIAEGGTSKGSLVPEEDTSVETSDSQPIMVPADDREEKVELDPRNQVFSDQSGRRFSLYIQRLREERKAMIESFVKKYKKSNNGGFPSITLTQKEVGGDFYAVRHILQELKGNQGSQTGPTDEFPRGAIYENSRSSASSSPNGTVTVPDEHPRLDGEGQHHPISDAASKHEVIENPTDGDLINVENVDSGEEKVVAGVLSSRSSEVEQLTCVEVEAHPVTGKNFEIRNDTEIQGGDGSLENTKHAKEVPIVVLSAPSLEIRKSVEQFEASGSMRIDEVGTSSGAVVPEENVIVETSNLRPIEVPTDAKDERVGSLLRNQVSSSDTDGSLKQPCIKTDKAETAANDARTQILDGTSARQSDHQQTVISENVQHRKDASMEESRLEVVPMQKAKTIGASLKSFVVDAFRKLWSG